MASAPARVGKKDELHACCLAAAACAKANDAHGVEAALMTLVELLPATLNDYESIVWKVVKAAKAAKAAKENKARASKEGNAEELAAQLHRSKRHARRHALLWAVTNDHFALVRCLCGMAQKEEVDSVAATADGENLIVAFMSAIDYEYYDIAAYLCHLLQRTTTAILPLFYMKRALVRAMTMGDNLHVMRMLYQLSPARGVDPELDLRLADVDAHILLCAIEKEKVDVVRFLVSERAPELRVDVARNNNCALLLAVERRQLDVVRLLCELPLERGVDPAVDDQKALRIAANNGDLDVVRCLCELPSERGVVPSKGLNDAAACGRVEVVRYLCEEQGVRPGGNALRMAVREGRLAVVKYLCELPLDRGVDLAWWSDDLLWFAHTNNHHAVVEYLCSLPPERGIDPAANDNALLCDACDSGDVQTVRFLCELPPERGVDPECRKSTPLYVALLRWHTELVEYLAQLPIHQGTESDCDEELRAARAAYVARE